MNDAAMLIIGVLLGALVFWVFWSPECQECLECPVVPQCMECEVNPLDELFETAAEFYEANPWNESYKCLARSRDLEIVLDDLGWDASIQIGMKELDNGTRKGHAWINVRTTIDKAILDIQFGGKRQDYPIPYSAKARKIVMDEI